MCLISLKVASYSGQRVSPGRARGRKRDELSRWLPWLRRGQGFPGGLARFRGRYTLYQGRDMRFPDEYMRFPDQYTSVPIGYMRFPDEYTRFPDEYTRFPNEYTCVPVAYTRLSDQYTCVPVAYTWFPHRYTSVQGDGSDAPFPDGHAELGGTRTKDHGGIRTGTTATVRPGNARRSRSPRRSEPPPKAELTPRNHDHPRRTGTLGRRRLSCPRVSARWSSTCAPSWLRCTGLGDAKTPCGRSMCFGRS